MSHTLPSRNDDPPEEPECPDDICYICQAKLKDNPEPGDLAFDGYCSQECKDK